MKITTFNPQIITRDAQSVLKVFEELGFERRHGQENVGSMDVKLIRMRDPNGFHLDISETKALPVESVTAIRMNVDDFDEAYEFLTARGFKKFYGEDTVNLKKSRSAVMISPSRIVINLVQHIK